MEFANAKATIITTNSTNTKLLHYQANNYHTKLAFNLSGLLLVDGFLVLYINMKEDLERVQTLWTVVQSVRLYSL